MAFTLYLLLVQAPARFVPYVLALGVAFCNVWNFPDAIRHFTARRDATGDFIEAARHRGRPLGELAIRYVGAFSYASVRLPEWSTSSWTLI